MVLIYFSILLWNCYKGVISCYNIDQNKEISNMVLIYFPIPLWNCYKGVISCYNEQSLRTVTWCLSAFLYHFGTIINGSSPVIT